MYLIVGLGNPDLKYLTTYHNLGFMVIDRFCLDNNLTINQKEHKSLVCKTVIKGEKVIIAKPQTYMNLSGEAVMTIANFYKIPTENILVIYDDLDLKVGDIRLRKNGSAGTHNGMRNIVKLMSTTDIPRLRIGSKQEEGSQVPTIDYVLSNISKERTETYKQVFEKSSNLIYDFIGNKNFDNLMSKYN